MTDQPAGKPSERVDRWGAAKLRDGQLFVRAEEYDQLERERDEFNLEINNLRHTIADMESQLAAIAQAERGGE